MTRNVIGIKRDNILALLNRGIGIVLEQKDNSQISVYDWRKRIQLLRPLYFLQSITQLQLHQKVSTKPVMRGRIIVVERNGLPECLGGFGPVPCELIN